MHLKKATAIDRSLVLHSVDGPFMLITSSTGGTTRHLKIIVSVLGGHIRAGIVENERLVLEERRKVKRDRVALQEARSRFEMDRKLLDNVRKWGLTLLE